MSGLADGSKEEAVPNFQISWDGFDGINGIGKLVMRLRAAGWPRQKKVALAEKILRKVGLGPSAAARLNFLDKEGSSLAFAQDDGGGGSEAARTSTFPSCGTCPDKVDRELG